MTTLQNFISNHPSELISESDMSSILSALSKASVEISRNVNRAGLIDITGAADSENVQGEVQQKLDILSDDIIMDSLKNSGLVAAGASEENEEIVVFNDTGDYVVTFDPLDGSSNIDVNVSIGTIFSVYKKLGEGSTISNQDFLRKGSEQVMAGYVIYGSSTMLVFTVGNGVNGFTLDPETGEYGLSHPDIKTPEGGKIYSLNEGNALSFPSYVEDYVNYCKSSDNDLGKAYSARYIGSMVADFHRNLIKGGIFMYPSTSSAPKGKLRILYECHPLSFVAEQAGGMSSDGENRLLEVKTESLHQRTPIFIGSKNLVEKLNEFIQVKQSV